MIKWSKWVLVFLISLLGGFGLSLKKENMQKKSRPNIILILVDDMGFSDLGAYGGEIMTPHIDSLAKKGLQFTQFYNAARCVPSRGSLLTGLYPHRAGVGHMIKDMGFPGYRGELSSHAMTIAEVLKQAGYSTSMTGKWHLVHNLSPNNKDEWPLQRGFDEFYGTLPGYGSYWNPRGLMKGNEFIKATGDFYYTEAITDHAIKYIKGATKSDHPFFSYVAYTAPHYPLHARQKWIKKYQGHFKEGWDVLRKNRYKRLIRAGIINSKWKLSSRDQQNIPWKDEPFKEWQQNRMETYAAMISQVDAGIGKIIKVLKHLNQLDNTLILFMSDNGASAEGHRNNKIERWGVPWEGTPKFTKEGKKIKAGDFPDLNPGPDTTFGSYGLKWANLSNTPFRLFKSWAHEGGIAAPMIAFWPDGIKDTDSLRRQPTHIIDIMPTVIDVAGAKYPSYYNGKKTIPLAGKSLLPVFYDHNVSLKRSLFWEHEGNRAIRKGKWKLVSQYPGSWKKVRKYPKKGRWELYNMEIDRTELHDVADQHPKLIKKLAEQWEAWAQINNVLSWKDIEPNGIY